MTQQFKVTPEMVDEAIAETFYFTAAEGASEQHDVRARRGNAYTRHMEAQQRESERARIKAANLHLVTFCIIVLDNGFKVIGTSACVDPATFDEAVGRALAYENAKAKVWEYLGMRLADQRVVAFSRAADEAIAAGAHHGAVDSQTAQGRGTWGDVIDEIRKDLSRLELMAQAEARRKAS